MKRARVVSGESYIALMEVLRSSWGGVRKPRHVFPCAERIGGVLVFLQTVSSLGFAPAELRLNVD